MMGRLFKFALPPAILMVAMAGAIVLWNTRPEVEAKSPEVEARAVAAVAVEHLDQRPTLRLYGAVIAGREVELRPLAAGRIVAVGDNFADGGVVRAGDTLIVIDPFDYEADVAELAAQVAEAQAKLDEISTDHGAAGQLLIRDHEQFELARREVARQEKLADSPAASPKALDDAHLALSIRAQQVIQRQQTIDRLAAQTAQQRAVIERRVVALDRAKRKLEETRLVAPFDGYLVDTDVAIGKRVDMGDRVARLIDAGRLEVKFHVSGAQFTRLLAGDGYRGMPAEVVWRIGDQTFRFVAVIDRVEGEIDAQSGGVDLYARIEGAGAGDVLRPGAFVDVTLADRLYKNVVRLPESALHDGATVYVAISGVLEARQVEVVARGNDNVLVRGALASGELVVTTRLPEIGPGLQVDIK
ncbi:MAG: efflux RND transporter periplasmic adaptor subunit [Pseudomonadota bacterium]|nr:efflux RND transporter periplasmic adaptor subunit [Pseudomonadota bacterium]